MINQEFVKRKIELIREDLELLSDIKLLTFDELIKGDPFRWNGVQHILQKIIGRAIDINQHLIAELADAKMSPPEDYTETFLKLKELGILPAPFTAEIAKSAGFRNAIAHEYNNLDEYIVYRSIADAIKQYTRYCNIILQFLKKQN